MTRFGSTFESWLDEEGIREEVTAAAVTSVVALQFGEEMKKQGVSKVHMAERVRLHAPEADDRGE